MKSTERHKLKENDLARTVEHAREMVSSRQNDIVRVAVIAVVLIALVGGFTWWRQAQFNKARAALAAGLAVFEAPVIVPTAPAPGSPVPVQQPGTFQTEQAKLEERAHEEEEKVESLENEKREATRQHRELEAIYEAERAQAMKEKEGTQAREEELQETIQRLKETMATKNVQGVEEGEAPLSRTCKLDPTA